MRKNFDLKKIVGLSVVVAVAIVISTSIHEFLHFAVGRLMGIPTIFLNMTAVGIPNADVDKYPEFSLMLMNGIAPIFSVLVFGLLGYLYCTRNNADRGVFHYFISWITALNVPYLGMQMLLSSTRIRYNGTGNDFAAVAGYFGVSMGPRVVSSVIGYIVFLVLLFPLRAVFFSPGDLNNISLENSIFKRLFGLAFLLIGFVSVCIGNWMLFENNGLGMSVIFLGACVSLTLAFAVLIPWKNKGVIKAFIKWILPGLLGSIFLLPIGIVGENDYAVFAFIVIPTSLGAVWFSARKSLFVSS